MNHKKTALTLIFFITNLTAQNPPHGQWTWLFKKKFTKAEQESFKSHTMFMFCKTDTPSFSQLIFSWNAVRPLQGYFSFYAQTRSARTKQWDDWHHMIDWGNGIQQSYFNQGTVTKYCHVRLESPANNLSNGFRIKVIAHGGASLSLFHALSVNISNLYNFVTPSHDRILTLPSLLISSIPQQSQMILEHPRAEHMCSPTSCSMLVSYLNREPLNALDFALNVHDKGLDSFGSWPFNTAHAFEKCHGKRFFYVTRLNSFSDIYIKLQKSIPVIVSVRGQLDGAPREFKNGHLLMVIGWDQKNKKVICHDPAFDTNNKVLTSYDLNSFCTAWARSHHLAYSAE